MSRLESDTSQALLSNVVEEEKIEGKVADPEELNPTHSVNQDEDAGGKDSSKSKWVAISVVALAVVFCVVIWAVVWSDIGVTFFDQTNEPLGFVLIAGILVISLFFGDCAYEWYKKRVNLEDEEEENQLERMTKAGISTEDIQKHLETIVDVVEGAQRADEARRGIENDREAKKRLTLENAAYFLENSQNTRNILTECTLRRDPNNWKYIVWNMHSHWIWQWWIQIVIVIHIILSFFESEDRGNGIESKPDGWQVALEAFILVNEVVDVLIRVAFTLFWEVEINILTTPYKKTQVSLHGVVVAWVFIDFFISLGAGISLEYIIPVRPFILVFVSQKVFHNLVIFIEAIYEARDILFLYFTFIVVSTVMGLVQFRGVFEHEEEIGAEPNRFQNFLRALSSMFVFVSSNENYSDIVYEAVNVHPWSTIFLLLLVILGSMIMFSMVTGIFENSFNQKEKEALETYRLFERTGIIAAFVLIDIDDNNEVSLQEFVDFINTTRPNHDLEDHVKKIFHKFNKDGDDSLDIGEFVEGVEALSVQRLYVPMKPRDRGPFRAYLIDRVLCTDWFRKMSIFIVILQIWVIAFYGSTGDEGLLDELLAAIMFYHVAELVFRIIGYGPHEFWYHSDYINGDAASELVNRYDFVLIGVSLIGSIVCWSQVGSGLQFASDDTYYRVFLTLTTARIFVLSHKMLPFVFITKYAFSPFSSLLVLFFCVFFAYGVIGVTLFRGKYDDTGLDYDVDFDTLDAAFLALFQCFVGEAFHEIMYVAVDSTSWGATFYFVSFVILVTVLFGSIFFGLILSVMGTLYDAIKDSGKIALSNEEIMDARLLEGDD